MEKNIVITGINSKYQMKQILGMKQSKTKIRSVWDDTISDDLFTQENQHLAISALCNNEEVNPTYLKEITNKLNGYKNQDILKKRYNDSFITNQQTIELLHECNLSCAYCNCFTKVLYKNVREETQWTLDRIDNDIGHTKLNVVISCLKCNLQRKRISAKAFTMTKQMVFIKVE